MEGSWRHPGGQVTLANWRTAPFSAWSFHHVRELIPSADIPNDPERAAQPAVDLVDLRALPITTGGGTTSLDHFLEDTSTDGFVVLHDGRVVFEHYANGMTAQAPHILMSVSKSLLGLLAGVLAASGDLDLDRAVTDYVGEVGGTAYRGATVRQLLDMRAGIEFDEDYLATSGPIVAYRKATNWNPLEPGERPSDLHSFYRELTRTSGPHGGVFRYASPNTDLLGWVIERAAGGRYADLMSERIWRPMGATRSAYITVDRLGAPRCAGGMCVTVRDLALVGDLMVRGGARGGTQIVPEAWIADLGRGGDAAAWTAGNFADYFPGRAMRYRSQWYAEEGAPPLLFGLGIHGQHLFVDRARRLVVAKVSSQALPLDWERIASTTRAVEAIGRFLGAGGSGAAPEGDRAIPTP
jgi:CubicO group peptidase (beta-lactamase class C family)